MSPHQRLGRRVRGSQGVEILFRSFSRLSTLPPTTISRAESAESRDLDANRCCSANCFKWRRTYLASRSPESSEAPLLRFAAIGAHACWASAYPCDVKHFSLNLFLLPLGEGTGHVHHLDSPAEDPSTSLCFGRDVRFVAASIGAQYDSKCLPQGVFIASLTRLRPTIGSQNLLW